MTRAQQRAFVRALCNDVRDNLIADLPKLPEDWNGIELRDVLAERFEHERHVTGINHADRRATRARQRAVRNELAVRGLR